MRPHLWALLATVSLAASMACESGAAPTTSVMREPQALLTAPAVQPDDLTDRLRETGGLAITVSRAGTTQALTLQLQNSLEVPLEELKIIIIDNPVTRRMPPRTIVLHGPEQLLPGTMVTMQVPVRDAAAASQVRVLGRISGSTD